MNSPIQDIEHRHGQDLGVDAAKVAIEGETNGVRCSSRYRQRDSENCVRAESLLVLRAIERAQACVDCCLIYGIDAKQGRSKSIVNARYYTADPFAVVTLRVIVPEFGSLAAPGGSA